MLPFTGLTGPYGVAVDNGGDVYITARQNNRVLKLADGGTTPIELPFTGLNYPSEWPSTAEATSTSPIAKTIGCSSCLPSRTSRLVGVKFTVRPSLGLCRGEPAGPMPKSRVSQTTVFGAQRPMLRTLHD